MTQRLVNCVGQELMAAIFGRAVGKSLVNGELLVGYATQVFWSANFAYWLPINSFDHNNRIIKI